MLTIERIEVDKENKGRYIAVFCEGALETKRISIDESTMGQFFLRKGLEIDEFTYEEIMFVDAVTTAYKMSLSYLTKKRRTTYEVHMFLQELSFQAAVIQEACKKLQDYGLLQDEEYAKAYVRTRKNVDRLGKEGIERLCVEKGLSAEEIAVGLCEYPEEEELRNAAYWLHKANQKFTKYSNREQKRRMEEFLKKKGFNRGVVQLTFDMEFPPEAQEDSEWKPLVKQGEKLLRKYANIESGYERQMKIKQALYRKGFQMEHIQRFLHEYAEGDTF